MVKKETPCSKAPAVTRKDPTAVLLRRLVPAAILVPLLAGLLHLWSELAGIVPIAEGAFLLVVATIVGLLAVLAWTLPSFRRLDAERSHAEEALRESEERFRTAFEHAPIGMALVGLDGRWLDVNRAFSEIVGYPREELLQKSFQDLTHPSDVESDLDDRRRLVAGELLSTRREKRFLHRDGHIVWTARTASLVRNEQGEALYLVTQIRDVTDRRRAEDGQRLLAEAGALLAASLDPAVTLETLVKLGGAGLADWCAIDLLNPDGRVENVAVATGDPVHDPELQALLTAHPGRALCSGSALMQAIRTGTPEVFREVTEEMLETWGADEPQGSLLRHLAPRSLMVAPLVARGRILGAMLLASCDSGRRYDLQDLEIAVAVAQRGALALDNAHLYQTAERAIRIRDQVLAIVAHDLRSPLTVIAMHVRTLHLQRGTAGQSDLELIQQAVGRATCLINDLLDAARMEAGQLPLVLGPTEVYPILEETLRAHRLMAEEKLLRLEAGLIEEVPAIQADRGRILQILANLVGNAIKFTPEGGRVTVGARREGTLVRFSVGNSGPGIPPEEIPHLFKPFWQARRGGREGAGLGLSIVRGLVEAHGGLIRVESTPGICTSFFFTIPLAALPPTTNSLSSTHPESASLA